MTITLRAKLVLLGTHSAGKTCFFNGDKADYVPTVSVTTSVKHFSLPSNSSFIFEFLVLDTPGNKIFSRMIEPLVENPCFTLLFCDVSSRESIDKCKSLLATLPDHCTSFVLVTKTSTNHILERELNKWIKDHDLTSFRISEGTPQEFTNVMNSVFSAVATSLVSIYTECT
ncbi:hypothetical protein RCL1_004187 [Eukaryota sp. TZLM3-RCL]